MRKHILLAVLFIMAGSLVATAAEVEPEAPTGTYDGRITSVAVFKNGYGFFRVEGEASPVDGRVEIAPLPAAALGTWWFYSRDEGVVIETAVAGQRDVAKSRVPLSLDELLASNAGREATVQTETQSYTGTIIAAPGEAAAPPEGAETAARIMVPPAAFRQEIILKTPDGVVAVRRQDVKAVAIRGGMAEFAEKDKESYVTLQLSGAGDAAPLGYEFLQRGIRWIPSYRISVIDDSKVEVLLQADVINDVHDLEDATLELVVGVPNFMHGELLSPLACLSEMPRLSQFFQAPGRAGAAYFSNVMVTQAAGAYKMGETRDEPAFTVPDSVVSQGVQDLFYYTRAGVTLAKGERAALYLFTSECPYRDVYKWKVAHDTRAEHCLRIENTAGLPFTSGPALLLEGPSVLAQDNMLYTSAGDSVDVKVTDAVDIRTNHWENELSRKHNALVAFGRQHDEVEARGTLTVRNFKDETVHVIATKEIDGTVKEASDGADVNKYVTDIKSVNPHSKIEWEFDLEPGAEKEMTYVYTTYVRP